MIGGIKFRNRFKYGSVICLKMLHGWRIQSTFGNHVRRTRTNRRSRYSLMNDPTAEVMSATIFFSL
jgi:hypothetical protein